MIYFSFLLGSMLLALINFLFKPEWSKELKIGWSKLNLIALSACLVLWVAFYLNFGVTVEYKALTVFYLTSMAMYILIQTLFTDGLLRLADRFTLRVASILVTMVNFAYLHFVSNSEVTTNVYVAALAITFFVSRLNLFEASDGRVIIFIAAAFTPHLDKVEFLLVVKLLFIEVLLSFLSSWCLKKVGIFKNIESLDKVPLAPILLAPFVVYSLYHLFTVRIY